MHNRSKFNPNRREDGEEKKGGKDHNSFKCNQTSLKPCKKLILSSQDTTHSPVKLNKQHKC